MYDLTQFLELFNPLPGNCYLEVSVTPDEITQALYDMLDSVDGNLSLALYNDDKKTDFLDAKVENIDDLKKPFRAIPRNYDIVVFKDIFHKHQNQKMILKIAYTALANTADIIIMEKKGILDLDKVKEKLENFEFRAANDIDIVDGYDLIMAKKMHMWGNGL